MIVLQYFPFVAFTFSSFFVAAYLSLVQKFHIAIVKSRKIKNAIKASVLLVLIVDFQLTYRAVLRALLNIGIWEDTSIS